jgi:hypothetical protein
VSTRLRRDPDRLVQAFLETGPELMSDHLLEAIVDDIHRTRQRGLAVPWRFPSMTRLAFVAAASVLVVSTVVVTLALSRPGDGRVAGEATPAASSIPTPPAVLGANLGPAGTVLSAATFSEPFTFTMPAYPEDSTTPVRAEFWDPASGGAQSRGMRLVSSLWGSVSFHDDESMPADMCRPSGDRIDDIPATPEDVDRWLRSGAGLEVSVQEQLTVDGRPALRWEVSTATGVCEVVLIRPAPWFGSGERHRIYAVPTGSDTILVITWGVNWSTGTEEHLDAVNAATDALVRSMTFSD